jgi:drug/metabolite transporter (DMT)-like permease
MEYLGIIFALVALLCWGFGDFFIQKASRKIGVVQALFFNTVTVSVVLLPFVYKDLPLLLQDHVIFWTLIASGILIFFTAILQYKVLAVGKLSVVEPVASLELPFTVLIAAAIGAELLGFRAYALIAIIFVGILLTVSPKIFHIGEVFRRFEKGTFLALAGALGMALTNYLFGHGSQISSPLLSMWLIHVVITVIAVSYLIAKNKFTNLPQDFKKAPGAIIAESTFDNIAWLAFSFAAIYIPISIAITISESYIILAVLLGVFINKEKLKHHQFLGVALAFVGVLLLALIAG